VFTPLTRVLIIYCSNYRIDKKNVMPYGVWDSKLRYKLQVWYKIFTDFGQDVTKVKVLE